MVFAIFQNVSIWIIVIPFAIGLVNYKGLNRDSKWIFYLVSAAMVPQLLTAFLPARHPVLNYSYNLYVPVEFAFLYTVFISKYRSSVSRLVVKLSAAIFILAYVFLYVRLGFEKRFVSELLCVNNPVYLLWILMFLRQEYGADETMIKRSNPFAWYFFGLLQYAPCTVPIFALYQYPVAQPDPLPHYLLLLHSIFNILMYLLFSIGLLIRKPH